MFSTNFSGVQWLFTMETPNMAERAVRGEPYDHYGALTDFL
jgi:hypothetical protein